MSNLTLRVSGEKMKRPLKRQDESSEELGKIIVSLSVDSEYNCLEKLVGVSGIEQQLEILRDIVKGSLCSLGEASPESNNNLEAVTELYLSLDLKNPLRSALARLLSSVPEVEICNIFVKLLCRRFNERTVDLNTRIKYVTSISGCIDGFPAPYSALVSCRDQATSFLVNTLQAISSSLKIDEPPAKKLMVINGTHNVVRCLISLIQKTEPIIPKSLLPLSLEILEEQQLPLDSRSTCGILCVMVSKELDENNGYIKILTDHLFCADSIIPLCICTGILNVVSLPQLKRNISNEGKEVPLFELIFITIMNISSRNPSEPEIVLGTCRAVHLFTKCLTADPSMLSLAILHQLLPYTLSHLEHYMDAVRHLAASILTNIVALGNNCKENLFDVITHAVDDLPECRRSKLVALCSLVGHISIVNILLRSPKLVQSLLASIQESSGATHAVSTFDVLMTQHYKEVDNHYVWITTWVDPLLAIMKEKPNSAFELVLSKIIKLHPDIIHYIISNDIHNNHKHMDIVLTCLRVSRKAGFLKDMEGSKWKGLIDYEKLEKCVYHLSDEVRLAALALISDSQKSTEVFTKSELYIIEEFFIYNVNIESPAVRQKILATFKKISSRLRDSMYLLEKSVVQKNRQPPGVNSKNDSVELLLYYNEFIKWLVDFCIYNLFPGASFSRRGMVLNILTIMKEHGFSTSKFHLEYNAEVLLNCLTDTYEENKELASNLLQEMPIEVLHFHDPQFVQKYICESIKLASSIKPPDSITAAYSLKLLVSFPSVNPIIRDIARSCEDIGDFFQAENIKESGIYSCLCLVVRELKRELDVAEKNLLTAASSGPLYGQLFIIRTLLQKVNLIEIGPDVSWQIMIKDLVKTAFRCNDVVACIVNSSSPEGLLPMDLDFDVSSLGCESEAPCATAQMVLLCSWRTVKDVSLLLGELTERAPISGEENSANSLLTQNQVIAIGDHLTTLLAETKHRGAFEQAYVGFCKLASRLWRFPSGNLHELPTKWLNETLLEITTNGKLCATRRSAGIPFMIQGLICTELEIGGGKCFKNSMDVLLQLGGSQESSKETRTHAMNILRSLFRNSRLGEMVNPYVPQGIALAVQGFSANTWGERNSATLLLSALMTRVFGVPRSRSHTLNWRNKMTGRIFFQRYPTLFGVLLKHLECATSLFHSARYPVLLILGRLYPSSLEGTDSNLQLYKYIPYVNECAGSSILKTRSLAASAMVALITPNIYLNHMDTVFNKIASKVNENLTHGLLLQIIQLLKFGPELDTEASLQLKKKVQSWAEIIYKIITSQQKSFITKASCSTILCYFAEKYFIHIESTLWSLLESKLITDLFQRSTQDHKSLGLSSYETSISSLFILICLRKKIISELVHSIRRLLSHPSYDVYCLALDFISVLLNNFDSISNINDVNEEIADIISAISKEEKLELSEALKHNEGLVEALMDKMMNLHHYEDRIKVLLAVKEIPLFFEKLSKNEGSVINFFYNACQNEHDIIGSVILLCINSYLHFQGNSITISETDLDSICKLLDIYTSPEVDHECRIASAKLFLKNFDNFIATSSTANVLKFWSFVVQLLNDDEIEVRNLICGIIDSHVTPPKALRKCMEIIVSCKENEIIKAALLISLAIGDCRFEQTLLQEQDDRVFDKGDMNIYCEEFIVNKLACKFLKHLRTNFPSVFEVELSEDVHKFLSSKCSLNQNFRTLLDFIHIYKTNVEQMYIPVTDCPFLKVSYKSQLLRRIKIENILSAVT